MNKRIRKKRNKLIGFKGFKGRRMYWKYMRHLYKETIMFYGPMKLKYPDGTIKFYMLPVAYQSQLASEYMEAYRTRKDVIEVHRKRMERMNCYEKNL